MLRSIAATALLIAVAILAFADRGTEDFHFVVLGDRTGDAQPGVFEEALREAAASHPDFVVTVGDAIEGGVDAHTSDEWNSVLKTVEQNAPHLQFFFTPGNHDVWSDASAQAFEHYTKHLLHYSFDYGQAHFTVLDNSRTDQFSPEELSYLEDDLSKHSGQPLKFVISHRPSWILQALVGDRKSVYQQLAEKYHVQYFISGHIHQMLYFRVKQSDYLCMPSAGGHLRGNKRYESGWFFAETQVEVHGTGASFTIHELKSPFGQERTSRPQNWGAAGLVISARESQRGVH